MPERASVKLDLSRDPCDCHILPCSINYEGPVDRTKFPIETSPRLFTRLRGRPLQGRSVDLAAYGYRGVCVEEALSDFQEDADPEELGESDNTGLVQSSGPFHSITVWEHGKEPAKEDAWGGRLEDLLRMSSTMEKLQAL